MIERVREGKNSSLGAAHTLTLVIVTVAIAKKSTHILISYTLYV